MSSQNILAGAVVMVLLVGVAAFYGGMKYESSKMGATMARSGQFAGRMGGPMQGRGRMGAGFVNGEVLSRDENSITVKTASSTQIVFMAPSTTVLKSVSGEASDLVAGVDVTAMGTPNADGSITAQSVSIRPAGMARQGR